jgi:hypothetical protein
MRWVRRTTLGTWRRNGISDARLHDLLEVLLGMTPDLHHCLCAHIRLDLPPISVVKLQSLDEALMLVIAPTLTSFGKFVRLSAAL